MAETSKIPPPEAADLSIDLERFYRFLSGDMQVYGIDEDLPSTRAVIRRLIAAERPIPVSERLPELVPESDDTSAFVLVHIEGQSTWLRGYYDYDSKCWRDDSGDSRGLVTHWLPMPPAPERSPTNG